MALLYADGFAHYSPVGNVLGNRIWTRDPKNWAWPSSASATDHGVFVSENGKFLLQQRWRGIGTNNISGARFLLPKIPASGDTFGVGVSFRFDTYASFAVGLFEFGSSSSTSATNAGSRSLEITTTGQLRFIQGRPGATSLANSGAKVLLPNLTYYIETKIYFHASAGTVEVRVNGEVWILATGLNTLPVAQSLNFIPSTGTGSDAGLTFITDFVLWDGTGSFNNDFLGEVSVDTLFVNADSTPQDWAPSTGLVGFDLLNDVPPMLTTYVQGSTVGNKSVFGLADNPDNGNTIFGVRPLMAASKSISGAVSIKLGIIPSSTETQGTAKAQTQDTMLYYSDIYETDPETSAAWTAAKINSSRLSIERTV